MKMRIFLGNHKFLLTALILFLLLTGGLFIAYNSLFGAPQKTAEVELFATPVTTVDMQNVIKRLKDGGFIRNTWAFNLALSRSGKEIEPGGYYLSKSMDTWQVVERLTTALELKWVVIPEGLRKEEIGEILAKTFNWSQEDLEKWNNLYTRQKYDYVEGVYFPDTYLIPVAEKNFEVVQRFINRFNEKFAPYFDQFAQKDIMWTTGLRLASVVQREAAGKEDMPLIAGILWNRLLKDMKLEVDATVQYARGKTDAGWWSPIKPEDKEIDSPYNTYLNKGLPPHPIANPGLDAVDAVLNPAETDCLYYLHDSNRQIHCAATYAEHLGNIDKYLK